jgi:hypothetical protein
MNFTNKPEISIEVLSDSAVNTGDRHWVLVSANGWGRLTITNGQTQFRVIFFNNKQWKLSIPKEPPAKMRVVNLFGESVLVVPTPEQSQFLPAEAFFEKIEPRIKKSPSLFFRALPKLYIDSALRRIRSELIRGDRIRADRMRLSGAIRIGALRLLRMRQPLWPPKEKIRDRITPVFTVRRLEPSIKKNSLNIAKLFEAINKETPREHR